MKKKTNKNQFKKKLFSSVSAPALISQVGESFDESSINNDTNPDPCYIAGSIYYHGQQVMSLMSVESMLIHNNEKINLMNACYLFKVCNEKDMK